MIRISIIIPVFNSESSIEGLVESVISTLKNQFDLEVILVNDASTDTTEQKCLDLYEKHKTRLKYFSLAKNVGEHSAVMAGLAQSKGDYMLIMDDDFQNPPSELMVLINAIIDKQVDVVYSFYDVKKHSLWRNFASKLNDKMACWMLNKPKDLYLSSFKIMNRFIVNEIIKYDLPFPYIDGLILRTTDKIDRVKVLHSERKSGKSGYTLSKLFSLWSNMFLNFSLIPLRFVIIVGFLAAFIGFLFGIFTVIEKVRNPDLPAGYSTIIIVITFFSGLILIGIGMVGEYIGRIFLSQAKKPQYTIRKKLD